MMVLPNDASGAALRPPPSGPEWAAAAAAASASLAACGGGGGTDSTAPGPSPISPVTPVAPTAPVGLTRAEASRLLGQATFAATDASIARLQALGASVWLDEQFAAPRSTSRYDWMLGAGYGDVANINSFKGADNALWRKLIVSPDALRQRVTLALTEIFVISMAGLPISWRGFIVAAYVDMLEAHAFGTYRDLLQAVTLSPGMGLYLNLRGNQKGDASTGRQPDENYAREVLQLLSIGLVELAADGTPRSSALSAGPVDTYNQATITDLARVFTGWDFEGFNRTEPGYVQRAMVLNASKHDTGSKTFLGTTVPAGTDGVTALRLALDAIAGHANVGPFIGRQLIQRLVASHPSAAYVGRVSAVFADNGAGVRGDLKAVIKAVLLDPEARAPVSATPTAADTTRGKLREPVQRFVQWARSFGLTSPTDLWNVGDLSDPASKLGQSPLRSPSVFNFFRPGYVPPNSALGTAGITAPEFQITNESTVMGWANFMQTAVVNGVGETRPDYTAELALAADAPALVARVVLLLAADGLAAGTAGVVADAVATLSAATDAGKLNRVRAAVHLVLCAPDYLVQV